MIFEQMIWIGGTVSLAGLMVIIWCIIRVLRAVRAGSGDEKMRLIIKSVLPINLGAFFVSLIGLMMVITGIALSP